MEKTALEINNQIVLLEHDSKTHGDRFLKFPLNSKIDALLPLRELQSVINVNLSTLLPIPEVKEFWLGVINWRGQAVWILDLANFVGENHWYSRAKVKNVGTAMLIKVENETIGFLTEKVNTVLNLDPNKKLPLSELRISEEYISFFSGYFLDSNNDSLMVLDIENIFKKAF